MGALRKVAGRVVTPATKAEPAVPETVECVTVPNQPQYRPDLADDSDSGGGGGCFTLPAGVHCEFRTVAGGRTEEVCVPIGEIEVCT